MFTGKSDTDDATIDKFGTGPASDYTTPCNTDLVLVEVNSQNDPCRHQFKAKVTYDCGLAEVYFKFGQDGGGVDSYAHEIKIKKVKTDIKYKLTLDGQVSKYVF